FPLAAAVLSLGFAPAPLPRPNSTKEDMKKLQGGWVRVQLTIAGRPTSDGPNGCPITITGDRLQFPSAADAWTITLDARKKPKWIDYTGATPSMKGTFFRGIYRIEGDTLTICVRQKATEKDRPTDFSPGKPSKGGFEHWIQVYKRKKP